MPLEVSARLAIRDAQLVNLLNYVADANHHSIYYTVTVAYLVVHHAT
jgi:hypothetical protein